MQICLSAICISFLVSIVRGTKKLELVVGTRKDLVNVEFSPILRVHPNILRTY